jgi:hypothetical protein
VGLVKNTKYYQLREDFLPTGFFPIAQNEDPGGGATFVLRAAGPPGEIMQSVKTAVAEVNPGIGVEFRWLSQRIQESLVRDRLMATLSAGFGLLAGLLATLGLYGVISYMVARRRNEIGVRIALGADRSRVIRLVLREAGLLLAVGLVVGVGLSIWAGRAASALLFGLQPHDPIAIGAAMALLAAAALAASYLPARLRRGPRSNGRAAGRVRSRLLPPPVGRLEAGSTIAPGGPSRGTRLPAACRRGRPRSGTGLPDRLVLTSWPVPREPKGLAGLTQQRAAPRPAASCRKIRFPVPHAIEE